MTRTTGRPDVQDVRVTHPERVLFPDAGLTKGDLVAYYRRVAPFLLPYLAGRPLTLHRFPRGIEAPGFLQKAAPARYPDWIRRVEIPLRGEERTQRQVVCDSVAALAYVANESAIALHPWLSREDDLEHPDRLVFDLDPPGNDFAAARHAALRLREALEARGTPSFVMTSGSRGLHVVVPLDRSAPFDAARAAARALADQLAAEHPRDLTTALPIDERKGRVFVDYLRNAYGQTSVAPYSVRALPGAPVATPLAWEELEDPALHARRYTMRNLFERVEHQGDPWEALDAHPVTLDRLGAAPGAPGDAGKEAGWLSTRWP